MSRRFGSCFDGDSLTHITHFQHHRWTNVAAELFVLQGRDEQAVKKYQAVLERKPYVDGVHLRLGDIYARTGRAADALQQYKAEAGLSGSPPKLYLHGGTVLETLGEDDNALAMFLKARPSDSYRLDSDKQIAKIYFHRKQYREVIRLLTKYEIARPADSQAHYLLMQSYGKIGQPTSASRERPLFKQYSQDEKERGRAAVNLLDRLDNIEQLPNAR